MSRSKYKKRNRNLTITLIFLIAYLIYALFTSEINNFIYSYAYKNNSYSISEIPEYNGHSYVYINDNIPEFSKEDMATNSFEKYSDLDLFGRAGVAYANIGKDLMPTEKRESIGMIKPSGWQLTKYDFVDGKYLYNRCHLIGFQLTGENANEKNLITCTRTTNAKVMVEFENKVAKYIRKTNNHVLYRVTPIYKEANLVASGVQIEALSIEDNGKGIMFNVYIYNVQDNIEIDYRNGNNRLKNS